MDIIIGNSSNEENVNNNENNDNVVSEVTPENFIMPEQAEKTLDFYITKLDEYNSKIGEEKVDVISQKALALEAILGTDMLKID